MRDSHTTKSPPRRDWPRGPSARRWRAPGAGWSKHMRREARLNMSHVDEGTLHVYLDGELAPVERERVDTHLRGCPACQARLAEERALIERASRLLGIAAPPERAMPPLQQLRQPRLSWRLRRPLAWAATLILAVGIGWYARGMQDRASPVQELANSSDQAKSADTSSVPAASIVDSGSLAMGPHARLVTRSAPRAFDTIAKDRDERQLAAVGTTNAGNGLQVQSPTPSDAEAPAHQKVDAVAQLPSPPPATVTVREGRAASAEPQPNVIIDGAPVPARRAAALLTTSWPLIAPQPAREVLGTEPAVIPGFAVRAYRRNPVSQEIAVEQV